MGRTRAKVKIYSTDKTKSEDIELLADTGSTYTWIYASMLDKLGIQPKVTKHFKTIEGRLVERKIGEAPIELNGEIATAIIVFAEPNDSQQYLRK